VIHVTVETPSRLDAEQEKLLRDLAKLRGEEQPPGKFSRGNKVFFLGSATLSTGGYG